MKSKKHKGQVFLSSSGKTDFHKARALEETYVDSKEKRTTIGSACWVVERLVDVHGKELGRKTKPAGE
ncbi:MAG: hypothetical protein ACM3WU_01305 [Bacillota bacterium]